MLYGNATSLSSPMQNANPNAPSVGVSQPAAAAFHGHGANEQSLVLDQGQNAPVTLIVEIEPGFQDLGLGAPGEVQMLPVRVIAEQDELLGSGSIVMEAEHSLSAYRRFDKPQAQKANNWIHALEVPAAQTAGALALPAPLFSGVRTAERELPAFLHEIAAGLRENARLLPFAALLILYLLFGSYLPVGVREYISALFR
jgi:hypothetical protein